MPLNADTLLDRIQLKAQATRWRILAIVAAVLCIVVATEHYFGGFSPLESSHIARLNIEGVIYDDPARDELIRELREDSKVKAVIVRLDTPGGSAVAGEELYLQLKALSKVKPVVSVMRTMAASAGYMVSLGTQRSWAREGTITGSIGVILQAAEFTELAKKLGITPITIKTGPYKASPNPAEKFTPDQEAVLQSAVQDFFDIFINMVVERRGLSKPEVTRLADGRIYTGRQAVTLKLIDAIGGEAEAIEWLEKNKKIPTGLEIRDAEIKQPPEDFLAQFGGSAAKTFQSLLSPWVIRNHLDGLVGMWQANTL